MAFQSIGMDTHTGEKDVVDGGMKERSENDDTVVVGETPLEFNGSADGEQLTRQYGLVGLTGVAVTVNNAWVVLGSSISVSICKSQHQLHVHVALRRTTTNTC